MPASCVLVVAARLLLAASAADAVCGDGSLQAGEPCDASAPGGDDACPSACVPSGLPGQCTCAAPSTDPRRYVLIADTQLRVGTQTLVISGNVAAVQPLGVLTIGRDALLPSVSQATGEFARLLEGAQVGRLFALVATVKPGAQITNGGPFAFFPPLPVLDALPPFPAIVPGSEPVTVPLGDTRVLSPGAYDVVSVGQDARLILRGLMGGTGAGLYYLRSLRLNFNAQLIADNPVVINVLGKVAVAGLAQILPTSAIPLVAGDVQLNVNGTGVGFSHASNVAAHVRAPRAKVKIGRGAFFAGRVIARRITTRDAMVTAQGACGDGLLDVSEECDTSAPGGDAACPGECIPGDPQGLARLLSGSPGQCTCRCQGEADCDDGNACNGRETCEGGACVAGLPPDCDDDNQCTRDCDPAIGCVNTPVPDGAGCNDGNACTRSDHCESGTCTGGELRTCDDNNPCTADACDPVTGCLHTTVADGTACTDGNACSGGDVCRGGACIGGPTVNCGDGNPCTDDTCDPAAGCTHAAVTDGAACSDGNACTTADTCHSGVCFGGPAPNCDDGNPCTADSCDSIAGCQHAQLPDGTACGAGRTCSAGVCP